MRSRNIVVERGRGERDQQGGFAIDAKIEQGRDLDGMGERVVAAGLGKRQAGFDGVEAKRSGVAQAHQRLEGEGALEKDDAVVPELCEWFAHCGPAPLSAWVSSGTGKRFPLGLLAWDTLPSPPGLCPFSETWPHSAIGRPVIRKRNFRVRDHPTGTCFLGLVSASEVSEPSTPRTRRLIQSKVMITRGIE